MNKNNCLNKSWMCCTASFIMTGVILLIVLRLLRFIPFGESSFVLVDAYFQYVDFFCFLRDVVQGANNISYTFSSNLGGSYIGQFAYYLASPLNLLILFFKKNEVYNFYNTVTALKMCLSAGTFSYFLFYRFHGNLSPIFNIALSICYGLMAYNLQQANNTMWLDGVYMLPLILLGVYQVVARGKITLLSCSVGLSILFNWYTGGINCIFSGIWLLAECYLLPFDEIKERWKNIVIKYLGSMLIGTLLSMTLFLPAIMQLRDGVGGGFDWNALSIHMQGNMLATMGAYYMGIESSRRSVSLFSGSLALLGIWALLTSVQRDKKEVKFAGALVVLTLLLFHWKPFFFIFSLLKVASSYWYRYSYIGCFTVLFLGALYFKDWSRRIYAKKQLIIGLILPCLLLILNHFVRNPHPKHLYATVAFLILINGMLYGLKHFHKNRYMYTGLQVGLLLVIVAEMGIHSFLFLKTHNNHEGITYQNYANEQEIQIDQIKKYDNSSYRILQDSNRENIERHGITAVYNESVGFNYWGIGAYTSVPQSKQIKLLDEMGYRNEFQRMNIVNDQIIPIDSFLGVKYIFSYYPIEGLKRISDMGERNNKAVYLNPYALPMAFVCSGNFIDRIPLKSDDPFAYMNSLYSAVLGKEWTVYISVPYREMKTDTGVLYKLNDGFRSSDLLYGNIRYKANLNGELNVNDVYKIPYGSWLTPSVFYIPRNGTNLTQIRLDTKLTDNILQAQFYHMDSQALFEAAKEIGKYEAKNITIQNGHIFGNVVAKAGDRLFLSVPIDSGWDIFVNGKQMEPELFAGCLITLPLSEGNNEIQMTYHIPGLKAGAALSVIGLLLLIGWNIKDRRKRTL